MESQLIIHRGVLWIMFIFPGLIYSVWRHNNRYIACLKCNSENIIPSTSPLGKKLLAENINTTTE